VKLGLSLREEHRFTVFENGVLRRIYGYERKVNGEWRQLHSEELHNMYTSSDMGVDKSVRMTLARHVARIGKVRNAYKMLVWKSERKSIWET
jgi:hypothetical protein